MLSVYIYPVCLAMFAACAVLVADLQRRGVSYNHIILAGGLLGAITFGLQYIPPPYWLMADFEKAYLPAGRAAVFDHSALFDLMSRGVQGFVNLPIVAFLFAPFAPLHTHLAGIIFLALGGLAGLLLWRELVRFGDLKAGESALLLFLLLGSGPAAYNLVNGNTSQMVLILIVWGIRSYMQTRDVSAGVLFALAALIKPALIVLGIFTLLRGRWRVTAAGAGVCAAATLLSILIFGWPMHAHWLEQVILPAVGGTTSAHNVQSVGGVVSRAIVGPAHLDNWDTHPVPASAILLTRTLQVLITLVIGACLLRLARRKDPAATAPLEFSFILMFLILIPNLSWSHYYLWAFIPLALVLRGPNMPDAGSGTRIAALVSAALMAQPVFMWHAPAPWMQEIFGRVIVSLPFVGALILLTLMVRSVFTSEGKGAAALDRATAFVPPLTLGSKAG